MESLVQFLQRHQIGRDVLANGGVRAAAGLHGRDPFHGQGLIADQKLRVFAREDVVGHDGQ